MHAIADLGPGRILREPDRFYAVVLRLPGLPSIVRPEDADG
jgi:hypothetical protein